MGDKKRVFIASSSDLEVERKELENLLHRKKIFEPILWENLSKGIEKKSFQETLNKELLNSQIVIFMIKSKLGKFSLGEFELAYQNLGKKIEKIHVCFFPIKKGTPTKEKQIILDLQKFLDNEGKIYEEPDNYSEFENYIVNQIDLLEEEVPMDTKEPLFFDEDCEIEELLFALDDFISKKSSLRPAMKLMLEKLKYIKIKPKVVMGNEPLKYCITLTDEGAEFLERNRIVFCEKYK